mgnify:CR=1 FL=1
MQITQKQIGALKGKCYTSIDHSPFCICKGTEQATIVIKKEWVECPNCKLQPSKDYNEQLLKCKFCNGKTKIPKYKVGQEIAINQFTGIIVPTKFVKAEEQIWKLIKLKIISETKTHWRVYLE